MKLVTLADVRELIERHLPAHFRDKTIWRVVAKDLKAAALGADPAEVSITQAANRARLAQCLTVDDAEYHLQVHSDARSPAALQLLGYASAAQRAAGVSRLVLHALVHFLRPEDCLAVDESDAHPSFAAWLIGRRTFWAPSRPRSY